MSQVLPQLVRELPVPEERQYRVSRRHLVAPGQRGRSVLLWGLVFTGFFLLTALRIQLPRPEVLAPVAFVALFAFFYWRQRRLQRLLLLNNEALPMVSAGDYQPAAQCYEQACQEGRGVAPYHAMFVANRACMYLRMGEPERALALFGAALRSGWLSKGQLEHLEHHFVPYVVLAWATAGDLPKARAWLSVAEEVLPPGRRGILLEAEALLLLREGQAEQAAQLITSRWVDAEGRLLAPDLKALRLLSAFALSRLPGDPARAEAQEIALAALVPSRPGQLDYLAARWPELAAFMVEQGLRPAA